MQACSLMRDFILGRNFLGIRSEDSFYWQRLQGQLLEMGTQVRRYQAKAKSQVPSIKGIFSPSTDFNLPVNHTF